MQGRVVRRWESQYEAGQDAWLLPNGHLLRSANLGREEGFFFGASLGGRIQEFTWDGELIWDFKFFDEKQIRHHGISPMPNGNVMMIVWERKTAEECIAAGVNPDFADNGEILSDCLIEVKPEGKTGGKIVWEWHIWDHLIQDFDVKKPNFGVVADHPELIDANFARSNGGFFGNFVRAFQGGPSRPADNAKKDASKKDASKKDAKPDKAATDDAVRRLQGIGYVGTTPSRRGPRMPIPDWIHVNAVSYNAKYDQVMLSAREFSEAWIVDHSTSTAEAAGHQGGRRGKGGDLLYRWGNPQTYRAGTAKDRQLFAQHDARWIPDGLPGAGHLLVFNNGVGRPGGNYSSVDEVVIPVDENGNYEHQAGGAFGPKAAVWSYSAKKPGEVFAPFMGGAQRLANGNTLFSSGFGGEIFEVTPEKAVVWRFVVPQDEVGGPFGFGPTGGFGRPIGFAPLPGRGPSANSVSLLPGVRPFQLSEDQERQLDKLEKDTSDKLDKLLTAAQSKEWRRQGDRDGQWPPEMPKIGEILPNAVQKELHLSDQQREQIKALQTEVDKSMKTLLTDSQKNQIKQIESMLASFAGGGPGFGPPGAGPNFGPPGGGPNFGPPGRNGPGGPDQRPRGNGGPPGFGPLGFGGPPGFGRAAGSGIFCAYRYSIDYPAFQGKDLTPGKTLVEIADQEIKKRNGSR